jgi:DNA repair protein RadA/Sms
MKAPQTLFTCTNCGAQYQKWAGRCSECGKWGTVTEESVGTTTAARATSKPGKTASFVDLASTGDVPRIKTNLPVWDDLLSGGMVPGSVTLLGGEPGIGKSTLLAQLALAVASQGKTVLYVTGEESPSQVSLRLKRLSSTLPTSLLFLDETSADIVASTIAEAKPGLTIVDSIQSMRAPEVPGEPGNPSQVRASAGWIAETAKKSGVPVILVGQVNKEGDLAGPRLLEHLVDTVIMMEGDRSHAFRLMRVTKHRFGTTDSTALLQMVESGLTVVEDPSAALLADRPRQAPGTVVTCLLEGQRPILVELQALVTPAGYGTPLRRVSGLDLNRLSLLLAVMGRRASVGFGDQDVFANAVGGIEAKETAVDLAICLAAASAKLDRPLPDDLAVWGEVGLTGEIRPVARMDARLKEAKRLGFKRFITPAECKHLKEAIAIMSK